MNKDDKDTIAQVLLSSFPREEDKIEKEPKEPVKNEYHFFRYENNNLLKITILIATILLLARLSNTPNIIALPVYNNSYIASEEIETIQHLVANVADCEQKSANAIHSELRRKFNYNSYKRINKSIYKKILIYLSDRTCSSNK